MRDAQFPQEWDLSILIGDCTNGITVKLRDEFHGRSVWEPIASGITRRGRDKCGRRSLSGQFQQLLCLSRVGVRSNDCLDCVLWANPFSQCGSQSLILVKLSLLNHAIDVINLRLRIRTRGFPSTRLTALLLRRQFGLGVEPQRSLHTIRANTELFRQLASQELSIAILQIARYLGSIHQIARLGIALLATESIDPRHVYVLDTERIEPIRGTILNQLHVGAGLESGFSKAFLVQAQDAIDLIASDL